MSIFLRYIAIFVTLFGLTQVIAKTSAEAISDIALYSTTTQAPLLSDYEDAAVLRVGTHNIDAINVKMLEYSTDQRDSLIEIQEIVDNYNQMINAVLVVITNYIMSEEVIIDAPTLTIYPEANTTENNVSVEIQSTAGNTVYINGIEVGIVDNNGTLEIDLPLIHGDNTIYITVKDANSNESEALVIHVYANVPPVANNYSITVIEDNPIDMNVTENDTDSDGDIIVVTSLTQGLNGSTSINSDGTIHYVPALNFNGTDSFEYNISDGYGGVSSATVNITVTAINDAPVGTDDSITTAEDTIVSIDILDNDIDIDSGDLLSITNLINPSNGTVSIVANQVQYTPNLNWNGIDTFTYTPNDGTVNGNVVTVTVNVTAVNDAPIGIDNSIITNQDTEVTIDVLSNDNDIESDTLTITNLINPSNGTVSIVTNQVLYTPNANWNGTDTFTYTPNDGYIDGNVVTVTVTVMSNDIVDTYSDTESYEVFLVNKLANNFEYTLKLGSNIKDVYLVFTNPELNDANVAPSVIRNNITNAEAFVPYSADKSSKNTDNDNFENIIPSEIREFNAHPPGLIEKNVSTNISYSVQVVNATPDNVGDNKIFHIDNTTDINATCKKVVSANGKTLNIWVEDGAFGAGCGKAKCMTQEMIDITADKFLLDGDNNDIYEYVTNVVGDEWNETPYSNLIDDNNEITILFFDIDNDDSTTGGTLGYFYSKDNYKNSSISFSNERIMFYIDSVLFATEDGATWDYTDFWPTRLISTLSHEFQHMIHYYQKYTINDVVSETWLNELCSMLVQDLVADKIGSGAPRGVDPTDGTAGGNNNYEGRLPRFNENNYISLTTWTSPTLNSYSINYAFGAFLSRNYGGANLVKEIVQNDKGNYEAIVDAVNTLNGTSKSFSDLMREWGASMLLSDNPSDDRTIGKYEYNINDYFQSTVNNIDYNLGSINMYNYSTAPTIFTNTDNLSGDQGKYKTSNLYYKVGNGLSGDVNLSITLDEKTEMTVIAK